MLSIHQCTLKVCSDVNYGWSFGGWQVLWIVIMGVQWQETGDSQFYWILLTVYVIVIQKGKDRTAEHKLRNSRKGNIRPPRGRTLRMQPSKAKLEQHPKKSDQGVKLGALEVAFTVKLWYVNKPIWTDLWNTCNHFYHPLNVSLYFYFYVQMFQG